MKLLTAGIVLSALSAWPLVLMAREVFVGFDVSARYSVLRVASNEPGMDNGARKATIGLHTVVLEDDQPVRGRESDARVDGRVRIVVDGRDYSHPALVNIRLGSRDTARYWGYVDMIRLVDREERADRIVVAQTIGPYKYRTLSLAMDGAVTEDLFDYRERCSPPIRVSLIRNVVPHPIGFCSDVTTVWPTIFYPILYPWISGVLGVIFVVMGGARGRHRADSMRAVG
jgi:hypothetical protein